MRQYYSSIVAVVVGLSNSAMASSLTLTSDDISNGVHMSKLQEFNGFGCTGSDLSPNLKWTGAPKETQSFAITAYDPDAPTGSGWWHWQIVNIPATVTELATGAGGAQSKQIPPGSLQIQNDYGVAAFGGACPPVGHGVHRYQFTVHALSVEQLSVTEQSSGALVGYMINAHTIESSTIEALYQRDK
ncbi:YbhB/YbcL family Raf kinase inhibitor-like protein [Pseudoalteromonas sp. JBTF-M23]|uniref:YbhB/YbcL family Raf kinase inhibitor-like protein n=1 Tax=Pseudoalteromonas caenipelagi TaxID=2726988 RepID=A0A849V9A8_9GAMM|nr:YbhB/YbcL family Raf kinase inhibitor-like protein [Pseudoalteromonas caenipelagi]NOU49223.1 YbhB/YbcL family Raf kinase inhibitor-like protein [Pseudoalteromonas caenipelagi]